MTKPGTAEPAAGAMTEALTPGAVLSTVTLKLPLPVLPALSRADAVYAATPSASDELAVIDALR